MNRDHYNIRTQLSATDAIQVLGLYQQVWWADKRTLDATVKVLAGSSFSCGVFDEANELVGFGRVVSDVIEKATIYDIIVHEDHHGKGLGKMIMDCIVGSEVCVNANHVELYCKDEMLPFYQKLGFVDISDQVKLLRLSQ